MTDNSNQLDDVLLRRWTDVVALQEAFAELEGRLGEKLEVAAETLRPWLEEQGYSFVEVEKKYARINVARDGWLNKKTRQPWAWFTLDALFPYGYQKVQEQHPYVWVVCSNLDKDDRTVFQEHLLSRLKAANGDWIDDDCTREYPAGKYLTSHGDAERLKLAHSQDALVSFAQEALVPILKLGNDVEAALKATLQG